MFGGILMGQKEGKDKEGPVASDELPLRESYLALRSSLKDLGVFPRVCITINL